MSGMKLCIRQNLLSADFIEICYGEIRVSRILGKRERKLTKFPANDQFAPCSFTSSAYSCLSVVQFVA